jgi:hypothetical protein
MEIQTPAPQLCKCFRFRGTETVATGVDLPARADAIMPGRPGLRGKGADDGASARTRTPAK